MNRNHLGYIAKPTGVIIKTLGLLLVCTTQLGAGNVDYLRDIKPLLRERCYACHGALKQESGLRLDSGQSIRIGADSGSIVSSDNPDESTLLERITSDDDSIRMPPIGKPLSADEVLLFRSWIADGAKSPSDEQPEADPSDHWAFKVPIRPTVPKANNASWGHNSIDAFLQATHQRAGIRPVDDANPAHVLRRVYLDLVGLPPTQRELQSFLDDPSDEAWLRIVNQLLESPEYGERWARHWMDVWRYSDWYGRRQQNDVRNSAPQIWRWRDWIVDSLNDDKGYARMVQEMLAADEIAAEDDSTWPATGYLIRNYYSLNPNEWMRHNVEYTAKAFLGLTFNCAHCHDHKYDPIEHDDYFRMRAFFEPMGIRQDRVGGEPEPPPFEPYSYGGSRKVVRLGMVRIYDERPDATTWFYTGGDERNRVKARGSIAPGVPSFLGVPLSKIDRFDLPKTGWYPGSRPHIQQEILDQRQAALQSAKETLASVSAKQMDTAPLQANVDAALAQLDNAIEKAIAAGEASALSGRQSLLLDAKAGRRIVQNTLPDLKAVNEGATISFRLRILKDNHVNFQLARDTTKHLTALYVGFVAGKIQAYRPGTFSVFEPATYDFSAGQDDFNVQLVIQPSTDTALLSVTLNSTGEELVSDVPIALNGWNSAKNPHQPMTLDCRSGTQVLIDDVSVVTDQQRYEWGFEPPTFNDNQDVSGISGWNVHAQSVAPAFSIVSMVAGCESARPKHTALLNAKQALRAATLAHDAAKLGVHAAQLRLQSAQATIVADNAEASTIEEQSKAALVAEVEAGEVYARWQVLDTEVKLVNARALPMEDQTRKKQISELDKQLADAKKRLAQATDRRTGAKSSPSYTRLSPTTSQQSTGRRRALAYWITDRRNPLTARVAINHIWMRHFHAPLVASVYDFGRNGKTPTHPQLLDWLAVELMDNDWRMKHIHRLIVTSRAYRMSSSDRGLDDNLSIDKDNRLLWRANQGRMESELVRDSILSIAGTLDATRGGQPLSNSKATSTFRRGLYYEVFPENGGNSELGVIFDAPDPTECFRRTTTIVPQQALALSNSKIIHQASINAAKQIVAENNDDFVTSAFMRVLSRMPNDRERQASTKFLARQREILKEESKLRESFIRVLFNHNDFVTIR